MLKYSIAGPSGDSMAVEPRGYLVEILTDDKTFDIGDSGKVFGIATDAKTLTLPLIDADTLGIEITVVNTGADGNNIITIAPNALDAIVGTIANAAADSVSAGAVDKDFVNTKTTANKGDRITLVAIAETEWYIADGVGIWASEG